MKTTIFFDIWFRNTRRYWDLVESHITNRSVTFDKPKEDITDDELSRAIFQEITQQATYITNVVLAEFSTNVKPTDGSVQIVDIKEEK